MALVAESTVLLGTVRWLAREGWAVIRVSPPRGITTAQIETLIENSAGKPPDLIGRAGGADILARKRGTEWRIECKGLPARANTLWSDFHRGLGEVVALYDQRGAQLRLGLALPDDGRYSKVCRDKLGVALREALNLWILFYDWTEDSIRLVQPRIALA